MAVDTQFHKFHGRPFARVLYFLLMKDISRWLPWVLPGSTGRFYKDDVVHNHSAHGYCITRIEGGVRYSWCWYMLNRTKQNWAKTAVHMIRELDLVTFHMEDNLSDGTRKVDVRTYDNVKTTGAWYSLWMLQQVTEDVQPMLAAQVNSAVSLDRTCMVNTTFSHHFFCSS